ncbi:MAG: TIGR02679 family protein, partial [Solirubrobacteraceae bacterium]
APLDALAQTRIELHPWTGRLRATGLVKRLADGSPSTGADLLSGVCRVIEALPCEPAQSLPAFSARVLGRAHALDDGVPLGTLALGAARALAGLGPTEPGESLSEFRREAWAAVGVLCDELSSVVLTLGLPGGASPSSSGMVLSAARTAGEPVWLTLRQLVRAAPVWEGITGASIVENPSVLAVAADRLGPRCPPLICTHGQPRAATMVLLRSLAAASVRLRHHGDFDWPGIAIANLLHRRVPMDAWRYDADTYIEVAEAHPHTAPLTGTPIAASWDPALAGVMMATGRQIEEELVASGLLEDLVDEPPPPESRCEAVR